MMQQRSDALARLEGVSKAVQGFADDPFSGDEGSPEDVSAWLAALGARSIENADAVSISVLAWPTSRTPAFSEDWALDLDMAQYASGRGPCLDAAQTRKPVRATIDVDGGRWPEFADAARECLVKASLSIPLLVGGVDDEQDMLGSLNVYSRTAAFDDYDEGLTSLFAAAAGLAIRNARREIDAARGVIMSQLGCPMGDASARLATQSRRRRVSLRTAAGDVLGAVKPLTRKGPHSSTYC